MYVIVERSAAAEIIQNRSFQNTEFSTAIALNAAFSGKEQPALPGLQAYYVKDGVILVGPDKQNEFILFDIDNLRFFSNGISETEVVTVIQKTLRFAIKYWSSLSLNSSEYLPQNSSKAVLFPFSFAANRSGYRVTIEREPNKKRLAKRDSSRYLLAYKFGTTEGAGKNEEADLSNFKRGYDAYYGVLPEPVSSQDQSKDTPPTITSLAVVELSECGYTTSPHIGFQKWLHMLSDKQKQFVLSDCGTPHRLEGPAGTGKTLCLVLKVVHALQASKDNGKPHKSIFIVPSDELANSVERIIASNGGEEFINRGDNSISASVEVTTLQRLFSRLLNYKISDADYLDRDSVESKNTQLLMLDQIVTKFIEQDLNSHKGVISDVLYGFLSSANPWEISLLLRHEISVVIKGRAGDSLEEYIKLAPLKYGLPVDVIEDKRVVYYLFKEYQKSLESSALYDIDDVVISAIGQLDTPIWRRMRARQGFDSIFIDEVHLFNINEISVIHFLSTKEHYVPISYSIDVTQALGDIGWDKAAFDLAFYGGDKSDCGYGLGSIFRSSPAIIDLAFSITSSGASLFTNFHNPLNHVHATLTAEEERKCKAPELIACDSDADMFDEAFKIADQYCSDLSTSRSKILIVVFSDALFDDFSDYSSSKAITYLKTRGDVDSVLSAEKGSRYVCSRPEHVGGLEFDACILVGVDDGRVPDYSHGTSRQSNAYINYVAHNLLYVAITRAKFRLCVLYNAKRGHSELLQGAINANLFSL